MFQETIYHAMQIHEGGSIHKHIDNFNQIILSLKTIHVALRDEDKVILLLSSLPRAYQDNLVATNLWF